MDENKENEMECKIHEEYQYLNQIKHVIKYGNTKLDRTGVGTRSVFGHQARYSLRDSNSLFLYSIISILLYVYFKIRHISAVDDEESVSQRNYRRATVVHTRMHERKRVERQGC